MAAAITSAVLSFPSTVLAGYLADLWGAKRTLELTLLLWIAVVLLAFFAQGKLHFWIMALGAASW